MRDPRLAVWCQHQLDEASAHEEDMAARIEALESELAATNVCADCMPS